MKNKVEVELWSGLRPLVEGRSHLAVEANTIGELLAVLRRDYPGLADPIKAGVSVAINGKIYARDLTAKIPQDAEVVLLQQIKGG